MDDSTPAIITDGGLITLAFVWVRSIQLNFESSKKIGDGDHKHVCYDEIQFGSRSEGHTMPHDLADINMYIEGCHMMRNGALERLSDADLNFSPGGDNLTLGELFKQVGEHQYSYIQSLITRKQDWSYRQDDPGLATSLTKLTHWFDQLDRQMQEVVNGFDRSDLEKPVDRTNGSIRSIMSQLDIYTQMMLIFLGKIVIYFKAMPKPLPPSIEEYIG